MTGNDLSRLLRDGTPEPRRALSADDLLHRARRRRAVRTSAAAGVAALATVAGIALALPRSDSPSRAPVVAAPPSASPNPTGTPGFWPEPPGPAVDCAQYYPDGLGDRANAFDATVTAVTIGPRNEDAGASPTTIDLRVHRVFAGTPRETVRLNTWDFMLPSGNRSVVGFRVLVATGPELDLSACGYSRPYSEADAQAWERVFAAKASGAPEDDCGIRAQPLEPGSPDESRLVGMTEEAAVRDVRSRGLVARPVGKDDPMTSDYRTDRVTMCVRDGRVTAAARF